MVKIPNELSSRFADVNVRKELIEKYGNSGTMFFGTNSDGEDVIISISGDRGIVLRTNQNNGWVRVNYYDKDGVATGESFDGKWR